MRWLQGALAAGLLLAAPAAAQTTEPVAAVVEAPALAAAPEDDSLDAAVVDAYAALFSRFHVGTPAVQGALRLIGRTLERLDVSVAWRLVQLATTSASPLARNFAMALSPDTRRALLRHWKEL